MSIVRGISGSVHLNGKLVAAERAAVSVFDRGLLYGDGLFETLRAYGRAVFALGEHLERLRHSARFLGFSLPRLRWEEAIGSLLERNRLADAVVRITVTRGTAAPSLLPPARCRPTTLITARPLDRRLARQQREGVTLHLLPFARDRLLAEHKTLDYLPSSLGRRLAARAGAFEGLFVGADGNIREGTTCSVFVVRNRILQTPLLDGILPGVTRTHILQLAARAGLTARETPIPVETLVTADEVFITSSVIEVMPVTRIDRTTIGRGQSGEITSELRDLYRNWIHHRLRR